MAARRGSGPAGHSALQLLPSLPAGVLGYRYEASNEAGAPSGITLLVNGRATATQLPWKPGTYDLVWRDDSDGPPQLARQLLGTDLWLAGEAALIFLG